MTAKSSCVWDDADYFDSPDDLTANDMLPTRFINETSLQKPGYRNLASLVDIGGSNDGVNVQQRLVKKMDSRHNGPSAKSSALDDDEDVN